MVRWILRLWPGAERFQREGRLDGLVLAITFSLLLNVSFFSVLIWPDAFPIAARTVVCLAVVLLWIASRPRPWRRDRRPVNTGPHDEFQATHLFQTAQREYLLGNWFQAEKLMRQILTGDPDDVPTRLRLAALYRRVGRQAEAGRELDLLSAMRTAESWKSQIRRERARLIAISKGEAA